MHYTHFVLRLKQAYVQIWIHNAQFSKQLELGSKYCVTISWGDSAKKIIQAEYISTYNWH